MVSRLSELGLDPAGTVRAVLVSDGRCIELVADFELYADGQSLVACMFTALARTPLELPGCGI
jgi:hypothetical protein